MSVKCWKCGQELADGINVCIYCGTAQSRPDPVTEVGRAMRLLFDRYGALEVLSNSAYLVNGLGDLAEDSKRFRNQIKMGMDTGLGRIYLEQLSAGEPDSAFDNRVKTLLTENAGLNEKAAAEIAGYFDEMIGWRSVQSPQKSQPDFKQSNGQKTSASKEVDRSGQYTKSEPELDRQNIYARPEPEVDRGKQKETSQPAGKQGLYPYEKGIIICFIMSLVLAALVNQDHDPEFFLDYVLYALPLIPLLMSFRIKNDDIRSGVIRGAVWLTIIVGLYIVFVGIDTSSKLKLLAKIEDQSSEKYLWQQHLLHEDIINLLFSIPLLAQMIRHRMQEKKQVGT